MHAWIVPALLALLALAGCAPGLTLPVTPPAPAAIAEQTTLDERAALGVEIAYRAAGALLERAIDDGRLRGGAAVRADAIDARAAAIVGAARAAYDAGNARSYAAAVAQAGPLIAALRALAEDAR